MKTKILEAIKANKTIILHRHVRPDPDAYGSQMGLAEIIRASFPEKEVYSVGSKEESLSFLGEVDRIDDSKYEGALVIVCDTANEERVSDQRYKNGSQLIKIDHHPNDNPYGDLLWVDTNASSCSEMIADFYESFCEQLTLNTTAARLLYAGIVGDTGRFLYPSTTEKTLRLAAKLVSYSFDRSEIYQKLYELPKQIIHLSGYVLEHFQMDESGAATVFLNDELLKKYQVDPRRASALVSILENVEGIRSWIMFIQEGEFIRARLRSKGPAINELAKEYHGGGHPLASGATLHDIKEMNEMSEKLAILCKNYQV